MLFDLADNLCTRYTALSPFDVRRERAGEVFLLIRRVNDKTRRERDAAGADYARGSNIRRDTNGNIHIRRRATDDMIF